MLFILGSVAQISSSGLAHLFFRIVHVHAHSWRGWVLFFAASTKRAVDAVQFCSGGVLRYAGEKRRPSIQNGTKQTECLFYSTNVTEIKVAMRQVFSDANARFTACKFQTAHYPFFRYPDEEAFRYNQPR